MTCIILCLCIWGFFLVMTMNTQFLNKLECDHDTTLVLYVPGSLNSFEWTLTTYSLNFWWAGVQNCWIVSTTITWKGFKDYVGDRTIMRSHV